MTDQQSDAAGNASTGQRHDAALNTIALVALCGVFAALDVLGMVYILVKRPGEDLTTLVMIGGVGWPISSWMSSWGSSGMSRGLFAHDLPLTNAVTAPCRLATWCGLSGWCQTSKKLPSV